MSSAVSAFRRLLASALLVATLSASASAVAMDNQPNAGAIRQNETLAQRPDAPAPIAVASIGRHQRGGRDG